THLVRSTMPLRVVAYRIPQAIRQHGETEGRNSQTSEVAQFLVLSAFSLIRPLTPLPPLQSLCLILFDFASLLARASTDQKSKGTAKATAHRAFWGCGQYAYFIARILTQRGANCSSTWDSVFHFY